MACRSSEIQRSDPLSNLSLPQLAQVTKNLYEGNYHNSFLIKN
jgi:hypothetical protein